MITINEISKSFDGIKALDNISIEVEKGELFGLIGPDGAGKTTLIRILATLLLPDSGSARVLGKDVIKDFKQLRRQIGYMPGRFSLYEDLSVEENLSLFASIYGTTIRKSYDLVKDIYQQIEPFKTRRAGKLSGGMKQKLALSCAMINNPKVLFLDEPTTGVDAVSRKEFWQMLHHIKQKGITILVSTPYMDEASQCDRVALIQESKLLRIDTPASIIRSFPKKLLGIRTLKKYKLLKDLRQYEFSDSVFLFGEDIHYTDIRPEPDSNTIRTFLEEQGHEQIMIRETDPLIEDCFLDLMETPETKLI